MVEKAHGLASWTPEIRPMFFHDPKTEYQKPLSFSKSPWPALAQVVSGRPGTG